MATRSHSTLDPFRPDEKIALVGEILASYVTMWRVLRMNDVVLMGARARAVRSTERVAGPVEHLVARRLGKVVSKTLGILPTDSRCLIRSLVLVRLLARRSIPSVLVIGVRKDAEFQAHAWVEHAGEAILPAGEYTRLMEL